MFLFQENSEERPVSVNKQRLGAMGDRPARPTLIEQVLNQKRLVTTILTPLHVFSLCETLKVPSSDPDAHFWCSHVSMCVSCSRYSEVRR